MTRWGERCQLPSNSLTTCSMGAGRTPHIRFSSFMVRMDIWSSLAAQRKEMPSLNNTKGCFHSSARSKKRGVCHIKRQIRLAFWSRNVNSAKFDWARMRNQQRKRTQRRIMNDQGFTTSFSVAQTPEEVFNAINNVRGWWSGEIDGDTDKLGAEFTYRYKDFHRTKQKITELIPGKRVVWRVLDSNLSFAKEKSEWTGTDIVFEISKKDGKTEVRFTHVGLVPRFQCYGDCSGAWGTLVNENLRKLITMGRVQSDPFE